MSATAIHNHTIDDSRSQQGTLTGDDSLGNVQLEGEPSDSTPLLSASMRLRSSLDGANSNLEPKKYIFLGFLSGLVYWTYHVQWSSILLLLGTPSGGHRFLSIFFQFLAATLGVLVSSRSASRHGAKYVLLYALALNAVGSLLVAASPTIESVLLGRTVQYWGIAPIWSTALGTVGMTPSNGPLVKGVSWFILASTSGAALSPFFCLFAEKHVAPLISVSSYHAWRVVQGMQVGLAILGWFWVRRSSPSPSSNSEVLPDQGDSNGTAGASHEGRGGQPNRLFEALDTLKSSHVYGLSYAAGSPIWASLVLVWMQVSQFGWVGAPDTGSLEREVFERILPAGVGGMGVGALIPWIIPTGTFAHRRVYLGFGVGLLPVGLLMLAVLNPPDGNFYRAAGNGDGALEDDGGGRNKGDLVLLMVATFLSGAGAACALVQSYVRLLDFGSLRDGVKVIAASDALQLVSTLPLLFFYLILAQIFGSRVVDVVAAGGVVVGLGNSGTLGGLEEGGSEIRVVDER